MPQKILCLVLALLMNQAFSQEPASLALPQISAMNHDHLFPEEMEYWKDAQPELLQGIVEAEKLRAKLLSTGPDGRVYADVIAEAMVRFQVGCKAKLEDAFPVTDFDLRATRLSKQIRGEESIPVDAFKAFDGRWFGRWGDSEVNHDWRPTVQFTPPKQLIADEPAVAALQYAWISSGFGWNYLMATKEQNRRNFVLGMVYYFDGDNFKSITGTKAHVGIADSPTRLVWITQYEVFLEEVFPPTDAHAEQYVITTLYHNLFTDTPSVSSHGTQAIYTRDPKHRPLFKKFDWR